MLVASKIDFVFKNKSEVVFLMVFKGLKEQRAAVTFLQFTDITFSNRKIIHVPVTTYLLFWSQATKLLEVNSDTNAALTRNNTVFLCSIRKHEVEGLLIGQEKPPQSENTHY